MSQFNINSGLGQLTAIAMSVAGPFPGKLHVVCPSTDANYDKLSQMFSYDPDGVAVLHTTLNDAYSACVSGNDDVIVMTANGVHTLTAPIAWTKNRIHVIGLDGGSRRFDQGTKVDSATTGTVSYVLQVTGTRNTFKNIKFIQSSTQATALTVLEMGGEGNVYQNCSAIFDVSTNLGLTTAHEVVCGEDSGTFIDCTWGSDTLLTSGARSVFLIKEVTASQEFKDNDMRGCNFLISSSSSSALLMAVNSTTDVLFHNLFERCSFIASVNSAGGAVLTNAVASASGLVKGTLDLKDCSSFHCTDLCAGVTDQVFHSGTISSSESGLAIQSS